MKLLLGTSLETEGRIFTAFNAVEMGHLQRRLRSVDGSGTQNGQPSLLLPAKRTWRSEPTPASSAEELAQITESQIRRDTGDNGDNLSSDGLIVVHSSAAYWTVLVEWTLQDSRNARKSPACSCPASRRLPVTSGTAEHKLQVGESPTVAFPVSPASPGNVPSPVPVCRRPGKCC